MLWWVCAEGRLTSLLLNLLFRPKAKKFCPKLTFPITMVVLTIIRIWTPPVLQAKTLLVLGTTAHVYPACYMGSNCPGHDGLFARLLLIAVACFVSQGISGTMDSAGFANAGSTCLPSALLPYNRGGVLSFRQACAFMPIQPVQPEAAPAGDR